MNISLRPEHLTIVDEAVRHRWVTETAERTLDRLEAFDDLNNEYAQMAREQYDEMVAKYCEATIEALEASKTTRQTDRRSSGTLSRSRTPILT